MNRGRGLATYAHAQRSNHHKIKHLKRDGLKVGQKHNINPEPVCNKARTKATQAQVHRRQMREKKIEEYLQTVHVHLNGEKEK